VTGVVKRVVLPVVIVAIVAGMAYLAYPFVPTVAAWAYDQVAPAAGPPEKVTTAELNGTGPGGVLQAVTLPAVMRKWEGRDLEAARVVYRSTSGDDMTPTIVSGSVFVPKGDAPAGGWPVISLGHATLGIDTPCAPSLDSGLLGFLRYVSVFAAKGYAVALADFQGLGMKGIHPYSDSRTAGLNMIDAVRALRHTFPNVSDRWLAFGDSQGGGAAWAADEQAKDYAPELKLLGAVAASPPADMSGIVQKAQDGTLTPEQRGVVQAIIESLARLHPDLNRDDFRSAGAKTYWNVLTDCTPANAYRRAQAADGVGPRDFVPRTPEAAAQLRTLLQNWALPQKPLSAPLYVYYGGKDPYIDAAWTTAAIAKACTMGGTITIKYDPAGGHNPTNGLDAIQWTTDRFDGKPVKNDC
jgi:pimeloyl-ACP methyl ester carboxylesterase